MPTPTADPATSEAAALVEAVLLSADRAISASRLAEAAGLEDASGVPDLVRALNDDYERTGRAFRIEPVAGGFRVMTLPRFAEAVARVRGERAHARLSRAALETLAIVAYKQPITRAQLEAIRGVACGDILRSLIDRRLITIAGRAEELGRPMLYGTTRHFLDAFGLASVSDLPKPADLPGSPGA